MTPKALWRFVFDFDQVSAHSGNQWRGHLLSARKRLPNGRCAWGGEGLDMTPAPTNGAPICVGLARPLPSIVSEKDGYRPSLPRVGTRRSG